MESLEPRGRRIKVAHVVPHLDNEAAGPTQSVLRLCESLALEGVEVDLHTMAAGRPAVGVKVIAHKPWATLGRFGFSLGVASALAEAGRVVDVMHNHSLWSGSNMVAGLATRRGGALLVTSPRGTLASEALARSSFKKRLLKPLQWPAITRAACLHATGMMEYEDIRRMRLRHPVAIIPNGIDVPELPEVGEVVQETFPLRVLFLGRLHPIKGIEVLLHAWREVQARQLHWELVVAGPGEDAYVKRLRDLAHALRLERVTFPGPAFGAAKRDLYRSANLFVLPTKTENFGMAIAEALAHALPVITTRGAPWPGLVTHDCGWWVPRSQADIAETLDQAMGLGSHVLRAMGERGRQWMLAEFDWRSVARQMKAVYGWLLAGGAPPPAVVLE